MSMLSRCPRVSARSSFVIIFNVHLSCIISNHTLAQWYNLLCMSRAKSMGNGDFRPLPPHSSTSTDFHHEIWCNYSSSQTVIRMQNFRGLYVDVGGAKLAPAKKTSPKNFKHPSTTITCTINIIRYTMQLARSNLGYPNMRQTVLAAALSNELSQTVPQVLLKNTSTRPYPRLWPPASLTTTKQIGAFVSYEVLAIFFQQPFYLSTSPSVSANTPPVFCLFRLRYDQHA